MNKGILIVIILGIIAAILVIVLVVFSVQPQEEEIQNGQAVPQDGLELSGDVSPTATVAVTPVAGGTPIAPGVTAVPLETTIDRSLWSASFFKEQDTSDTNVQAAFGLWCEANPKSCEREFGND
ncbi:hypothetical protein ACFL2B_00570 [Patescibacteria group bacterium]